MVNQKARSINSIGLLNISQLPASQEGQHYRAVSTAVYFVAELDIVDSGAHLVVIIMTMPFSKPSFPRSRRNPEPALTADQKADKWGISQTRAAIEHAIGGTKRYIESLVGT